MVTVQSQCGVLKMKGITDQSERVDVGIKLGLLTLTLTLTTPTTGRTRFHGIVGKDHVLVRDLI